MAIEKLTTKIKPDPVFTWLDKKELIDKTETFEIVDAFQIQKDIALLLKHSGKEDALRISSKMKNELIEHFGDDPANWMLQEVEIKFTSFKPKDTQKGISEGVQANFIWTEEEELEN